MSPCLYAQADDDLTGNTADVTTLLPVIDRLRERFGTGRVCVVADRGMISAETIAGLEQRKLEYILGAALLAHLDTMSAAIVDVLVRFGARRVDSAAGCRL